jgi:hypothetical protein
MYLPMFALTAVLPFPNRSKADARRGRDVLPVDALRRSSRERDDGRQEEIVRTADRVGGVVRDAVVVSQPPCSVSRFFGPLILRVEVDGDDVAARAEPAGVGKVLGDLFGIPLLVRT